MRQVENENIYTMSVNKFVDLLSEVYINLYQTKGEDMRNFPSVMLWGPPGVGKSQGIRQIANRISKEINKEVHITDVRLLLFNPIDLRGIPYADKNNELAIWLKPKIFQMKDKDCLNILFLDEISAAPQSVQAAAYQITLDRKIGEHELPNNCIVIAAGNRVSDKSVATKMPKALANRLLHIEVEPNPSSWIIWAIKNNINEKVLGYLSENNYRLFSFNPDDDDLAFPTPRSWEMVSLVLDSLEGDLDKSFPLIAGLIGMGQAFEFKSWCNVYNRIPKSEDIFNGLDVEPPTDIDCIYALIASISAKANTYKYDIKKMENVIKYAFKLPSDFAELLFYNLKQLDTNYSSFLNEIPAYRQYIMKKGGSLNGQI